MNLELQVFLQRERDLHHGEDDASWHIRAKIAMRRKRSLNGLDQVKFAMIRLVIAQCFGQNHLREQTGPIKLRKGYTVLNNSQPYINEMTSYMP